MSINDPPNGSFETIFKSPKTGTISFNMTTFICHVVIVTRIQQRKLQKINKIKKISRKCNSGQIQSWSNISQVWSNELKKNRFMH